MPVAPITGAQDYGAQALSRVAVQYRESSKLLATISALADFYQEVENALVTIGTLRDITIAGGVNLDTDGELVGQSRELVNGDVIDDPTYRTLIQIKIARNSSHAKNEDLIGILAQIFGGPVRLQDYGGMAVGVAIPVQPTSDQIAILDGDILPRADGVQINPREWFLPTNHFGFAPETGGDQTALPFGEGNNPAPPGGRFAEIF
jgi:hypothetical protein